MNGLNQPFARNLAGVLCEMRAAGQKNISKTNINNESILNYLSQVRSTYGPSHENTVYAISNQIINALGRV